MDQSFQVILFILIGSAIIGLNLWLSSKSRSLVEQWAHQHGYTLLHYERRIFFLGPFFWTTSRSQIVYYLRIRDQQGTERTGWIRCGSWMLGLLTDAVEVRWEDEK